jgi:uncharacterized membrane protein
MGNQSAFILGALFLAFLIYVTLKGHLRSYIGLLL